MPLKGTASKVLTTGDRVAGAVGPITTIMAAGRLPIQAARAGGFAGVYDFYAHQVIPNWTPPGFPQFRAFMEGAGGASIMTGIGVGIAKWLVKEVGGAVPGDQSSEVRAMNMILRAIGDAAAGTAVGEAASMIIHGPTYGGAVGGGPGIGGLAGIDQFRGELKQHTVARKREEKPISSFPVFQ